MKNARPIANYWWKKADKRPLCYYDIFWSTGTQCWKTLEKLSFSKLTQNMNLKFAALGMALPIELIFCQLHLTNSHLAVLLAIYPSTFFLQNYFYTINFRTAFEKYCNWWITVNMFTAPTAWPVSTLAHRSSCKWSGGRRRQFISTVNCQAAQSEVTDAVYWHLFKSSSKVQSAKAISKEEGWRVNSE